jgi:integrase
MKKELEETKCTVCLRKLENKEEWTVYIESYPIYKGGKRVPGRHREYLRRTITTPIWDKSNPAKVAADGTVFYRPKRDVNGVILCKSPADQATCIFADKVRHLRQHEYDNESLYTEKDAEMKEMNDKLECDFVEYFEKATIVRHKDRDGSVSMNWRCAAKLLRQFAHEEPIPFRQVSVKLMEDFRLYLLSAPLGGGKVGTISQNTASTYFALFKAGLHQAFVEGYLTIDLAAKVKGISHVESRREYLTAEELNKLAETPCDRPEIKRAALFSALTGLRHSDIMKMRWSEIQEMPDGSYRLNFTQKKTRGVEYMPISEQAYKLCGERKADDWPVFENLPSPSWISRSLRCWIRAAGITRNITFHCFRHTYATLQLAGGTDIYTVSKMLGHTNVRTTQIYTKIVDTKKMATTTIIKLDKDIKEIIDGK